MKSPQEGPTAFRMSLRRRRGPHKFIVASLAIHILSRFREEIPFSQKASAVHTAGYCFAGRSPEGPTGWRGLLARGAYWPQVGVWALALVSPWLRACYSTVMYSKVQLLQLSVAIHHNSVIFSTWHSSAVESFFPGPGATVCILLWLRLQTQCLQL